ncbi:MAG: rhomboid family intramembrane serine protease [Microbacterium sp.]|uniref:rhomboid family intramembrane serine protease n=1 Tax=Microbacterium sp. TaxID=51671 RepID=UPI003A8BB344
MTTDAFRSNPDNFCYRHPDRQSFALCQRCGRTICGECQTQGAVGVICPECMREQRRAAPRVARAARSRGSTLSVVRDTRPLVTFWIMGITAVAYLTQLIPGSPVQQLLAFNSLLVMPQVGFEPWRLFTVLLVHGSFWHMGLNMLALFMIGRSLEPLLGRWRFLSLYLLSGLGGSVAVALLAPGVWVVGASGAIFGLFGALLVIGRHIGANVTGIVIIIAINFALPIILGIVGGSLAAIRISGEAHVGGFIVGAAVGFLFARTRGVRQQRLQQWLLIAVAVVLLALLIIPAVLYV